MPTKTDIPPTLRPFLYHGLELTYSGASTQAVGDCPFCASEARFYINIDNGLWDCKKCKAVGNSLVFVRQLWEASLAATKQGPGVYDQLATDRTLLDPMTLAAWGVCQSLITTEWLVPGFDTTGKL